MKRPDHIAFIPDGNRRWAQEKGVSVMEGHQEGHKRAREILRQTIEAGIRYASFWGLSLDNVTKRSRLEVAGLMTIFHSLFEDFLTDQELHEKRVRIRVLGRFAETFPQKTIDLITKIQAETKEYDNHHLTLLLAYNGTDEMLSAMAAIAQEAAASGEAGMMTGERLKQHLFTKDLPPVDLVVRTGGEPHLSAGFMMWDTADAELYFTQRLWPEFDQGELDKALQFYSQRQRRFGS